ncbi:MAG TPA: LuxR C-terminal-related transcriptional regulator [Sphingopyxis sp.]|nr:LuxR C-terminal-related transcriptional regulator [Sphingopyxis sp.]HMP44587.1 LuxR C-terminal-related transcriptional regulator [Sphingopyxis sp.]HMQ19044.1 LuxR C-terminal-related transcriptional regulator [Sphingopyxis sp.]
MTAKRTRGRPAHDDILTPAEWRVVEAVRHGQTNRAIAARLGVSADAVKYHVGNALAKLGFDSRAALRRWDGVRAGSAMGQRKCTMETALALGPIGQIARSVRDIGAARHFYGEMLGLKHLYSFDKLAFFDCGGVRLFLSEGEGGDSEAILYFRVAAIHRAAETLTARGVAVTHAPHMIHRHDDGTEEWMAFFSDNEDRPLALMEQIPPAAI